jgi:peroxiredoxin
MGAKVGAMAPDIELKNDRGEQVRLSDYWKRRPLLLVFLRHLGCPLCFDHVAQLRTRYGDLEAAGLGAAAVTMGDAAQAAKFRESQNLPCDVLADPKLRSYQAYGLEKGALWQYAGPQMWWRGLTSVLRYGAARPVGDVKQMPGAFVIDQDGKILYAHRAVHSGDHESYDEILRLFQASRTSSPPTAAESQ